jgi:hypothetical protein
MSTLIPMHMVTVANLCTKAINHLQIMSSETKDKIDAKLMQKRIEEINSFRNLILMAESDRHVSGIKPPMVYVSIEDLSALMNDLNATP